ncbi:MULTISPECIES: peptide MFS transporter [unclassified Proteiniphilum]|mgnify:CR=1 FL=1|uniref:peptide MFS transporter n=1 Tax=unclassified Proteiniphilum TaxID=2622718 RepID=UPI0025D39B9C|nr:peptide MFS transporter [Proteiniphilum sp. UBA5384]
MFKDHPKGLLGAALSNMGERFGFYIMMAILTLFISSKFGLSDTTTLVVYSIFYSLTYVLALLGGFIADKTKKYKQTIMAGLVLMMIGYLLIAIPTKTPVANMALMLTVTCVGLFVIALGNGFFKGNLQAVVGQLYDNPQYEHKRDTGFQIFYMFINIGAAFAPLIGIAVRNWWLQKNSFLYDATLSTLSHQFLNGKMEGQALDRFTELANSVSISAPVTDLTAFANNYLNVFTTGFHFAFIAAVIMMLVSLIIFSVNKNKLPDPANKVVKKEDGTSEQVQMDIKEVKQRIYALAAVFGVVIFFWFSFHQNGATLTFFARDYVDLSMININLGFTTIQGAEIFQSVNPLLVVLLTFPIIGLFGWLARKNMEPSTPRKIAIGMGIAALAYILLMLGSIGLPDASERLAMGGLTNAMRVSPWLLVGTYFILTVAELFISPLGLSFVSKVAPPHLQGLMQGCWLAATAVGNLLVALGGLFYESLPLWGTWLVFVCACSISMGAMLAMLKWLERVAK